MKIAVTGKGGVGKTTIVGLLARILRDDGRKVLAVDADPDMNLAAVLGVPAAVDITPIDVHGRQSQPIIHSAWRALSAERSN